ncbi:SCP2 sterol-binding domain-containing protein [Micromonospora sp. KC723]|uniref:SCP2 sterol-binding domain-containing protein n=1 Tax=Micromonospora sp. KC723 TaxID=2530381 RepID=UPI0010434FCC|nr:SCP2 sterol-binding domain-containing protein [Micromonospora sp. KC723]TDB71448.1 SCP2 sterol-binding domain-containing protein [Micromonospora sp. KC723]
MASSAVEFLKQLGSGIRQELPESVSGTVRLDLREGGHTEHWYLVLHNQRVDVRRSPQDADLVLCGDREAFDQLASGRRRLVESLMRNELSVIGDLQLALSLRRILPGPPGARHPREFARQEVERR